jgi:endonuclease-3 related protein
MALVIEDFNGQEEKLFSLTLRDLRNTLLSINGIGPETADDIIVYAALKPSFIIDQYTKRIASRVGITPLNNSYSEFQTIFEKKLPKDQKLYGEFHALLDKHGSNICTKKNPLCEKCCLQNICKHYLVNK